MLPSPTWETYKLMIRKRCVTCVSIHENVPVVPKKGELEDLSKMEYESLVFDDSNAESDEFPDHDSDSGTTNTNPWVRAYLNSLLPMTESVDRPRTPQDLAHLCRTCRLEGVGFVAPNPPYQAHIVQAQLSHQIHPRRPKPVR